MKPLESEKNYVTLSVIIVGVFKLVAFKHGKLRFCKREIMRIVFDCDLKLHLMWISDGISHHYF